MVAFAAAADLSAFPNELLEAVCSRANYQAELTAACIDATGLFPQKPAYLPAGFLLELAAVLQIRVWEDQGLLPYLPANLPTFQQAAANLFDRIQADPHCLVDAQCATLSRLVLQAWLEHCAWHAVDALGADVVVGGVTDEDAFVESFAQILFDHHHLLENALGGQDNETTQ